jgi:hypothetical protein
MAREVAGVGVEVDHEIATRDRERAPHRVALAERLAEAGQQLGLLMDLGTQPRGQLRGAVLGSCVHDQDLVDEPVERLQPLDDLSDRVGHLACGQHDRDRAALPLPQQLEREQRVVEGADHLGRTMASRGPCSGVVPLGGST